jgi:hypothetical protein
MCEWCALIAMRVLAQTCIPEAAHAMSLYILHMHHLLSAYMAHCAMFDHV